jgi:diguanylate cyclase (GGDEF)-like protein/PAS domain S-box-containing protein
MTSGRWEQSRERDASGKAGVAFDVDGTSSATAFTGRSARLVTTVGKAEQRRAKVALEASEERFRALVEKSSDVIALVDAEGTMLYTGPSTERVLGYRPEEIVGTDSFAFIHPEDRERAAAVMGTIFDTPGASASAQYRIRRKDGSWLWMEGTGTNHLNDPAIGAIVGNYRDITERKQAEDALRESEGRFRALVEHSWDAVTVLGPDSIVQYISPSTTRILGYTPDDVIGRTLDDLIHPDDLPGRTERGAMLLGGGSGTSVSGEMRIRHKDGGWRWLEMVTTNLIADPAVRGLVVNFRDISERKEADDALRSAETRYRSLVEQIPAIIYLADAARSALLYTSPQREVMLGYTSAEWTAEPLIWERVVHPDDLERVRAEDAHAITSGEPEAVEYRYIARDGRTVWVRDQAVLIRDENGDPLYWQGVITDITARKRAEEVLRERERQLVAQYQGNPIPMYTWQRREDDWVLIDYNRAAHTITRGKVEGIVGATLGKVYDDRPEVLAGFARCAAGEKHVDHEMDYTFRPTGERKDLCVTYVLVAPDLILVHTEDVTERKRAEGELRHHASHDPLTDLPNRALLMQELTAVVEHARRDATARYAVLFLDLDRFKHANDSFGHVEGDRLLVAIARRLRAGLPEGVIIARLGGDEFVVLLREIGDTPDPVAVGEAIHTALDLPFAVRGQEIFITASIGIASGDGSYTHPDDILRDADTAMYRAKALGMAHSVVFDAAMLTDTWTVVQRESALRRAIERREFEAFYQPIVALDTGGVIGIEALVRWRHPERGLVSPAEFIPLAEETGLIVAIDRWMLWEACGQLRRWDERFPDHPPISIGVNVSGVHLAQADFVAQVEAILTETGIDPERLCLEITESTLVAHTGVAAAALNRLHDLGVRIVLDDFGVGYSSLNYLRQFPIDSVKIDRSFTDDAAVSGTSMAIVRAIISLAHALDIQTVAEGIEHGAQVPILRDAGCDYGQGYFFSCPMPAAEAEHYLDAA